MLTLRNLGVVYPGGLSAVSDVNLSFRGNELVALLGPSGAGKSTLLRTLNFLTEPSHGEIVVDGIGKLSSGRTLREHRRHTAMVFQQHQLILRHTVLQNVLLARVGAYGSWRTLWPLPQSDRTLALQCLDRVGLLDKALERAGNLSGGQQQRVGVARALAQRPRLLLADEPVASLDPATGGQIMELLRMIVRQDGIPAIVSLHQTDFARRYADRVIGLADGRVVFDGPADALSDAVLARIYTRQKTPAWEFSPASSTGRSKTAPNNHPLELEPSS